MPPRGTRRAYLAAVAGTIGLGATGGRAEAQERTGCPEVERLQQAISESRGELTGLESETAAAMAAARDRKRRVMEILADHQTDSPFDEETRRRAAELGTRIRESVMAVDVLYTHGTGTGTGWFLRDGTIVTNAHNVDDPFTEIMGLSFAGEVFDVEVVEYEPDRAPDVAVLRTDFAAPGLETGSSESLRSGEPLVQVGHPGGFGFWVISLGRYVDHTTTGEGTDVRTDIPGLAGNSGSPILTLDGEVIGMTYSGTPMGGEEDADGDGVPDPSAPTVHAGLLAVESYTNVVPIESVMDRVNEWT